MARHVRFVPTGSNPTGAIRSGFYVRPPAFGGRLAPGEADAEARRTPISAGLGRSGTLKSGSVLPCWYASRSNPRARTSLLTREHVTRLLPSGAVGRGCNGMYAPVAAHKCACARR